MLFEIEMRKFSIEVKLPFALALIISVIAQTKFEDKVIAWSLDNELSHQAKGNHTKVTAQIGSSILLPCSIELNSTDVISWIRQKNMVQLLTIGHTTYSSDDRFSMERNSPKGEWPLRIKSVNYEDSGLYECLSSSHPPKSMTIELQIVEATAMILGQPDVYINDGSILNLVCIIKDITEFPEYVFWYHNKKMVNYDTDGGFSVSLIHLQSELEDKNDINYKSKNYVENSLKSSKSILNIRGIKKYHAGNYTCLPSNTKSSNIIVHVLKGEKPEAILYENGNTAEASKASKSASSLHSKHNLNTMKLTLLIVWNWYFYTNHIK